MTTSFFVDAVILPKLREFWTGHSDLQVTFSADGNRQPVDLEIYDIAIRGDLGGISWDNYVTRPLLETPVIICAAPTLIGDGPVDLQSLPWIWDRSNKDSDMRTLVRGAGVGPDAIRLVDPGDAKFEIEATVMGYGLSISTELVARRHLQSGALVQINTPLRSTAIYYAIHRKGPLAPPVQAFLDWLIALSAPLSLGADRANAAPQG